MGELSPVKKAGWIAWLKRLIGPAVLVYLLSMIDLGQIKALILRADLWLVVLGVLATAATLFFRIIRWHLINQGCGISLALRRETAMYLAALALALVTPGRAGELAKLHFVARQGYATSQAFASALSDRLADALWMAAAGYLGLVLYVLHWPWQEASLPVLAGAGVLVVVWAWLGRRRGVSAPARLEGCRFSWLAKAVQWLHETCGWLRGFTPATLLLVGGFTALAWFAQYTQGWLFARALGLETGFWDLALFVSVASLVSVLPFSVAGIGTRDLALVYLFGQVGQPPAEALAFSGLLLFNLVLTGLACSLMLPFGWGPRQKDGHD